jgi:hypothetical protein
MITIMWEVMSSNPTGRPVAELAQRGFRSPPDALYLIHTKQIRQMEANINRSDFAALDVIHAILRVAKNDMAICGETVDQLKWALDMIQHEVEQTGRVMPV